MYDLGNNFGLSKQDAIRMMEEVLAADEQFPDQCAKFGVPEENQELLSRRVLSILNR